MKIYIIIPSYNEEEYIANTLQSLVVQTTLPDKILVVNDNSTDKTQDIIDDFSKKYSFINNITVNSESKHSPGSKVINAFNKGLEQLDTNYDVICKFDADLEFPNNYIDTISNTFRNNRDCGLVGGFCYIEKNNQWIIEDLTNKDHIRGALKAYRKNCFLDIGGLIPSMGWDTVDEMLAQYHGWDVCTDQSLKVKHLKPTGKVYSKEVKHKQGEAFYKMRYGFLLTLIATLKLSIKKKNISFFFDTLTGYNKAKMDNIPFIVCEKEGKFIRNLRWKKIKEKIF